MNVTITELRRSHYLPKPYKDWRLAPQVIGQINGIPSFRGLTIATNGILVALITSAGRVLFGHLQWFIPDDKEEFERVFTSAKATSRNTKLSSLDEFIAN